MKNKTKMIVVIVVALLIIGVIGAVLIGYLNQDIDVILFSVNYGGYTTKAEGNSIKGKFIDTNGNVYEYRIPCNEEQEMSIAIHELNDKVVKKYKGNMVSKISKEELNILLENRNSVTDEYENKKIFSQDAPSSCIYVMSNGNVKLLFEHTSNNTKENISKPAKTILDIFEKIK